MSLIIDNTDATVPQIHVLVIGVGRYDHLRDGELFGTQPAQQGFGLGQLTSSVASGIAFADWCHQLRAPNLPVPLGSLEVVLSSGSYTAADGIVYDTEQTTIDDIQTVFDAWEARCDTHRDNIAIFYFSGHGIVRDVTLLLTSDFGKNASRAFHGAIDFSTTWDGMAACAAKTQLYIIDACRETPIDALEIVGNPHELKSGRIGMFPLRDAPVLNAAPLGRLAYGPPDRPSFFTTAVIKCLNGVGAAYRAGTRWNVTTDSLGTALKMAMERTILPGGLKGACAIGGESHFPSVVYQIDTAQVMASIACRPQDALADADLAVASTTSSVTRKPSPTPWEIDLVHGIYDVSARFATGRYRDATITGMIVHPPYFPCELEV